VGARIVEKLKRQGADLDIVIELVEEISLTSGGKRRFVINELAQKRDAP
jgi:hypothetical protein